MPFRREGITIAATYDTALTDPVHVLRHRLGDIDVPANPLMLDEEYSYEYAAAGNSLNAAAIACARRLQARASVMVDSTEGDVSKKWSQLATQYASLAESFADTSSGGAGAAVAPPYAGGISVSDVRTRELDTDRSPNAFGGRFGGAAYGYGPRSPWGW